MAIVPSIGAGLSQTTQAAQQVYRKAMGMLRPKKKRRKKDVIAKAERAARKVKAAYGKVKGARAKIKKVRGQLKKGSAEAKAFMAKLRKKRGK